MTNPAIPADIAAMTDDEALDELARLDMVAAPTAAQKARIIALELRLEQPVTDADRLRAETVPDDPSLAAYAESAPSYGVRTVDRGTRNPWPFVLAGLALAWWRYAGKGR